MISVLLVVMRKFSKGEKVKPLVIYQNRQGRRKKLRYRRRKLKKQSRKKWGQIETKRNRRRKRGRNDRTRRTVL